MIRTSLVLLPLVLAGCAEPLAATTSDSNATAPLIEDLGSFPFLVSGHRIYSLGPHGGPFEVSNGTTFLLMEAEWTCSTAACGMRLVLIGPDNRFRALHGDMGKERLLRDLPAEGGWTAHMWPAETATQASGEIRVTAFKGPIPPGYTAFG